MFTIIPALYADYLCLVLHIMKPSYKSYIQFTKVLLASVFIVILAGSIVRTTGSGMGCPDWPTCFGNAVPPTQEYQVHFQVNHHYKAGQFIIYNDSLKYAKQAFISSEMYDANNWQQYEKNNYATFNVAQTWIEYINRLATGLLGFIIIAHIIWSFRLFYNAKRSIVWWSLSLLLLTGFEAWLGKLVVDTNLAVVKITLHMLLALLIGFAAVIILHKLSNQPKVISKQLKWLSTAAFVIVLTQIILGTDVREQVDEISVMMSFTGRETWIDRLNGVFDFHRNFAWIAALICIFLFWQSLAYQSLQRISLFILATVFTTIAVGLILFYMNIPQAAQPLHLLLSSLLLTALFAYRLKVS